MENRDLQTLYLQFDMLVERFEARVKEVEIRTARIHAICDDTDKRIQERKNRNNIRVVLSHERDRSLFPLPPRIER